MTPFAWSQPHEVNAHVDGVARELRRRGHTVTVLAPSTRTRDLQAGRKALQRGEDADVIAVGPSIPLSRRTHLGVPVAVRANLRVALARGRYDVVHGFEPGLPSLSYLALTTTEALTAATFFSVDRLGYPTRRSRRDRLRARVDALLATSSETAEAASERFEGDYRIVPLGVDLERFRPASKEDLVVVELEAAGRSTTRALLKLLDRLPGLERHARPYEAARVQAGHSTSRPFARARSRRAYCRPALGGARARGDLRRGARRRGALRAGGGRVRSRRRHGGRRRGRSHGRAARPRRQTARDGGSHCPEGSRGPGIRPGRRRARDRLFEAHRESAGARRLARTTRSPTASGSPSTSTCTRSGRTTAPSLRTSSSSTPRGSASAASP